MSLGQNDNALLKLLADEALRKENAALQAENERLAEFMKRFDWILYTHNCKGGTSATHDALDKLRNDYLEWMNPEEEQS